jgi:hypothetical protein
MYYAHSQDDMFALPLVAAERPEKFSERLFFSAGSRTIG